jgi:hypothetical protein
MAVGMRKSSHWFGRDCGMLQAPERVDQEDKRPEQNFGKVTIWIAKVQNEAPREKTRGSSYMSRQKLTWMETSPIWLSAAMPHQVIRVSYWYV